MSNSIRGNTPISISKFKGLWARGGVQDEIPPDYALECKNVWWRSKVGSRWTHLTDAIACRPGISTLFTLNAAVTLPARVLPYFKSTGTRWLAISSVDGDLYDGATAIISGVSWTDFAVLTMNDRAYISPHNGVTGNIGESLYVYDGTTARLAAGTAPATGLVAATSATAGSVSLGDHLLAFAFETDTGFITKPSVTTLYTAPGGQSIDLTSIDTGPAGTVNRIILASKVIPNYDGNPDSVELFRVATLAGNVATILTIDFIDSALQDSADYLFDQLETIPAGVFMCNYRGRLVIGGEAANTTIARVSLPGFPESISSIDGFIQTGMDGLDRSIPGVVGGLQNGIAYKGSLYLFKVARSYVTYDNGTPPSSWLLDLVDAGMGARCRSIGQVGDASGYGYDAPIIANESGTWNFEGQFSGPPLSFAVADLFEPGLRYYTSVHVDPSSKMVYIANLNISAISVYFFDYSKGLTWDSVKWGQFKFSYNGGASEDLSICNLAVISADSGLNLVGYNLVISSSLTLNSYVLPSSLALSARDDTTKAINSIYTTGPVKDGYNGSEIHVAFVRIRAKKWSSGATGIVQVFLSEQETGPVSAGISRTLTDTTKTYDVPCDVKSFSGFNVNLVNTVIDDTWIITKIIVFVVISAEMAPQ